MSNSFHLSFVVPNLRLAQTFYVDVLACKKGRDTGDWIDIIFFGHQLTLHQESESMPAQAIDHFGVILEKAEWLSVLDKAKSAQTPFALEPKSAINEDKSESGKFIIKDPANNLIEFKFYQKSPVDMVE